MVSCGFHLHFPSDQSCWASFHVLVGHVYIFFEEISIQILCRCFLPLPPEPIAVKVWSLNHWTTREFPPAYFKNLGSLPCCWSVRVCDVFLRLFSPILLCLLLFHFFDGTLWSTKVFNLKSLIYWFFFLLSLLSLVS